MEDVVNSIPSESIIRKNPVEKNFSPKGSPKLEAIVDQIPDDFERSGVASNKCDHTCSITDAVRLLDCISEVPKASPLYCFAIKLTLNKDKREVFMALSPETKVWWLKMEEQESRK
jgi:hypothetical protein